MKLSILIPTLAIGLAYAQDTTATAVPQAAPIEQATQATLAEGTPLSGSVHGFIKESGSPYLVTENITVEENQTLVIEAGVNLQFAPGTGLYVKGQLVVAGSRVSSVQFESASNTPKNGDWSGIFISGSEPSVIRNAVISGANNGIVVENGTLNIHSSKIEKTTGRGVYARNSKLNISGSQFFNNEGAAVQVDSYSIANLNDNVFENNNVAIYNAPLAITSVSSSRIQNNVYGVLDLGNSHLSFGNSSVQKNKVGASTAEVLGKDVISSITENESNFNKDFNAVAQALPPNPEIPGISSNEEGGWNLESRPVSKDDKIGLLLVQKEREEENADTTQKGWNVMGNVSVDNYYHYVKTRKNHSYSNYIVMGDTVKHGDKFENIFQVPGFGTEASIYLLMQGPEGRTIEFNSQYTGDSWNNFNPHKIALTYTDEHNQLTLGDFNKSEGEIYMSSLSIFGANYTLSLLKNNVNQPLLELNGFFGEALKPYLLGDRHPTIYKNYIEDGEAQAQRLAYGASVKWAPLRRFDATIGAIYADDEIHDPLLRDGGSKNTITSEPMQKSFTMYADGNWLFYPGDIELKGQVAVGRADTADVYRERAINEVFLKAGLTPSSMSLLRQLMVNEAKISTLSPEELDEIFGDNTTLSRNAMRNELRTLIQEAKKLMKEYKSDREDDRVLGLNWGSQNFALGASLYWNIYKTTLSGHIKYVGEDFYSVGSADQLADTREFGGNIEQIITDFWTLGFAYQINVENAAKGGKTNLIGLGEGTHWGLFPDEDAPWFDKHELDNDRTKYIHNWNLNNEFKIGSNIKVNLGYNLEYRTQYRPYQLHGNYIPEDEIYRDEWFATRKDRATTEITDGETIIEVDSARWAEYKDLEDESFLASKFQERIYKNTWSAGFSFNAFKTIFKAGGRWTVRTDDSKFHKDSLIEDIDLSNQTLAKLGYYFGGADFFEHAYPLSATTNLNNIQNYLAITPRFKSYERNNMKESEITIDEEIEIPLMKHFLVWNITGQYRYLTTSWEDSEKTIDESEYDVIGETGLTVNHTKRLSSQWYVGSAMYYRPDNLSDEYKDIYGGIKVNYAF